MPCLLSLPNQHHSCHLSSILEPTKRSLRLAIAKAEQNSIDFGSVSENMPISSISNSVERKDQRQAQRRYREFLVPQLGSQESHEQLRPIDGLHKLCQWVTNAPGANAELIILNDFFQFVVIDSASGIKAGVAAGMPVIGLAIRNPNQILIEAGATFLIKNFEDPKLWETLEILEE
ncbi:haloacid dehalogenase-like hydrolase domain-containing protein Sgpp isoform X1 [Canna indica]|uniref:Haloacid dehalogenase-like hydrolase domain-containing protein Sgpp isoform X1 n=1 Tax=Canna indica TaxID=4628 RepID=A0AAQ3KK71_9LILI|nr:haloacid dehalogenase-like hydrolase domain-containing protein Sgpp isoform X1 [Canna indica]